MFVSRSLASKIVPLTLEVFLLFINLDLRLLSGVSVGLSFLLMRVYLSNVNILMVDMATSVGSNSFIFLRLFLGVVTFSFNSSVVTIVVGKVILNVDNITFFSIDLNLNVLKIFPVFFHLSFEIDDLLINNGLLLLFSD